MILRHLLRVDSRSQQDGGRKKGFGPQPGGPSLLLVSHRLQLVGIFAFHGFRDGDAGDCDVGRRAMPMLLARQDGDDVSRLDLLDGPPSR